jgi:hypothetical protein
VWDKKCFTGGDDPSRCERPETKCDPHAYHDHWTINLHASELAFQGSVCDWYLFWARAAYDYGRYLAGQGLTGRADAAYTAAHRWGRYVLGILAYNARHWIHEFGHAWLQGSDKTYGSAGGHCGYNCCNDVVADYWLCKVRGHLGLPRGEYEAEEGDDFAKRYASWRTDDGSCGTDNASAMRVWSCDVGDNGVQGQDASYCSTGCYLDYSTWGFWATPDMSSFLLGQSELDAVCPV